MFQIGVFFLSLVVEQIKNLGIITTFQHRKKFVVKLKTVTRRGSFIKKFLLMVSKINVKCLTTATDW